MKIKSALFSQASGSLAGMTASHNRGGLYLRARTIPVNPNSGPQREVRQVFADLAVAWQTDLSVEQREGWETYAVNVPVPDTLGEERFLTGLNHYVRSNTPRLQAGLSRIDDAPGSYNLGTMSSFETFAVTALGATGALEWNDSQTWAGTDGAAMLLYVSRPRSPAVNFFRGPYRFAQAVLGDSGSPPTSPTAITLPFGPTLGSKMTIRGRISYADGRLTSERTLDTIVV